MTKFLDENGLSYYNGKIQDKLDDKQDTLVSGTNIKTVNSNSLVGSGDIDISDAAILTYNVSTWADVNDAINSNKVVYLKVPMSGGSARYAALSYSDRNKAEFAYVRTLNRHSASAQCEELWLYSIQGGAWNTVTRQMSTFVKVETGGGLTSTYTSIQDGKSNISLAVNKATSVSSSSTDAEIPTAKCLNDSLDTKQDTLVSGTNIKTINNQSLLGSGDLTISGGGGGKTYYYLQGSGNPWGSTQAREIDFDSMEAGCRYIYYNKDATTSFYYKYTKKDGTVVQSFMNIDGCDKNRTIMSDTYTYYRRIEIECYDTVENVENEPDEGVPFCKIWLYPTTPLKNPSQFDDLKSYSAGAEIIWYGTGSAYGYLVSRQLNGYTNPQYVGYIFNTINGQITTLQTQMGDVDTALTTITTGTGV